MTSWLTMCARIMGGIIAITVALLASFIGMIGIELNRGWYIAIGFPAALVSLYLGLWLLVLWGMP
jgi:hypothetical protein